MSLFLALAGIKKPSATHLPSARVPKSGNAGIAELPDGQAGMDAHPRMAWRYGDAEEVVRDPTASAALRRRHADGRLEQCYRVTEGG